LISDDGKIGPLSGPYQPDAFGLSQRPGLGFFLGCVSKNLVSFFLASLPSPRHDDFWVLVCYAATQLATQAQQRRIQVVRSNKVARKRLTKSNGTPAMDLGHFNVVLK